MKLIFVILLLIIIQLKVHSHDDHVHTKSLMELSKLNSERIQRSGSLYRNDSLELYLKQIAQKLTLPRDKQIPDVNVFIIKSSAINAFATPHGDIFIYSGFFTVIENEAQLAALIGHEISHIYHNHGSLYFEGIKKENKKLSALQVGLSSVLGDMSNSIGNLFTMASITGYSQHLELEADEFGLYRMYKAGYDPREYLALFKNLKYELKKNNIKGPYFFSTHPKIEVRINNYKRLFQQKNIKNDKGIINNSEFVKYTIPLKIINSKIFFSKGMVKQSFNQLKEYQKHSTFDSETLTHLGDLYTYRGISGDLKRATNCYKKAILKDKSNPLPLKKLGLLHLKQNNYLSAKRYLQYYLVKDSTAVDHNFIEEYIQLCDKK